MEIKYLQNEYLPFSFVGKPEAKNDCWIVGDAFLNKSYSYLQDMGNSGNPIYQYVTAFMASPLSTDPVITRLRNCLVEGLNKKSATKTNTFGTG